MLKNTFPCDGKATIERNLWKAKKSPKIVKSHMCATALMTCWPCNWPRMTTWPHERPRVSDHPGDLAVSLSRSLLGSPHLGTCTINSQALLQQYVDIKKLLYSHMLRIFQQPALKKKERKENTTIVHFLFNNWNTKGKAVLWYYCKISRHKKRKKIDGKTSRFPSFHHT